MKRLAIVCIMFLTMMLGFQAPAIADPVYDFALSGDATANTTTIPSIITWSISVSSVGDAMGSGGAQEGDVTFTTPDSISLTLSNDCDIDGHNVVCYWYVEDGLSADFYIHGLVTLTALGAITVTPTITVYEPRDDSNASNDSITLTCTAVTSLLVVC